MDYIPMLALGAIFLVLGCFNIKGNISSIHWYNRRKGCIISPLPAPSSALALCCTVSSNTITVFSDCFRPPVYRCKMEGLHMMIENNPKELAAMKEFHKGNRPEGLRLQEEFAAEFREEYKDKDHCPCKKACRYHGNCKECVAIHRAHQEHVPNCLRPMLNKKIKLLSELTEHSLADEIEPPKEVLRKEFQEKAPG